MVPLPVADVPLPAYPQTGGTDLFATPGPGAGSGR
jgi:hypothetical protein